MADTTLSHLPEHLRIHLIQPTSQLVDAFLATSTLNKAILSLLLVISTLVTLILYRLYLHPLRNVPGPRLAAISGFYMSYFDIVDRGTFGKQLPIWHHTYSSPVIRIAPNLVHINDPAYFHEIQGAEYLHPNWFYHFGMDDGLLGITDPIRARQRRKIVAPLFSSRSIREFGNEINAKVETVLSFMRNHIETNQPFDLNTLMQWLSADLITKACFGQSADLLESEGKASSLIADLEFFFDQIGWVHAIPPLSKMAEIMPDRIAALFASGYVRFRQDLGGKINVARRDVVRKRQSAEKKKKIGEIIGDSSIAARSLDQKTIFDLLLQPDADRNYIVPGNKELVDEGISMIGAGTHSTSHTLTIALYHIFTKPEVLHKLRSELDEFFHNPGNVFDPLNLSQLPYLAGIIQESLRLSSALPALFPRYVPPQGLYVGGTSLPGGTEVCMTHRAIHDNPDIFPDPATFIPERWQGDKGKELDSWLVSFSKGPRSCLGENLSRAEMSTCLAQVVRRYDLKFLDTSTEALEWKGVITATFDRRILVRAAARTDSNLP